MSTVSTLSPAANTVRTDSAFYPEEDGIPLANNTDHLNWIIFLKSGLSSYFRDNPDIFVASDLLWYPVEGRPDICVAPDAMVAFGRPRDGRRGSYKQWEEGGIAPQVVFEVISPGNTVMEMLRKQRFFHRYGVEEYYIYDCEEKQLIGFLRNEGHFDEIEDVVGWTSPRLGLRFELDADGGLVLIKPDGKMLESYEAVEARAAKEAARAKHEAERAESLAAKLRELGIEE